MKMEHTVAAPHPGRVARICFEVGEQADEGEVLIVFGEE